MKISTRGRYGLRALVEIARLNEKGQVSVKEISARQKISENYLEQIIFPLKKAGIVKSIRGAQGGYLLARPAAEITVGDILRVLEGDIAPVECLAGNGAGCDRADSCPTIGLWRELNEAVYKVVDSHTLQDLVDSHTHL